MEALPWEVKSTLKDLVPTDVALTEPEREADVVPLSTGLAFSHVALWLRVKFTAGPFSTIGWVVVAVGVVSEVLQSPWLVLASEYMLTVDVENTGAACAAGAADKPAPTTASAATHEKGRAEERNNIERSF